MTRGRVAFVVVVAVATAVLSASILPVVVPDFLGIDFAVFRRVLTLPIDQLYADTGPMPFIYPPTAILPFMALGWMPYAAFAILSAIAFFFAVRDKQVAALSLLSKSAFKGLQLGQIPMLLAAGMFAALRLHPFAGGMLWGIIATIKPQLMTFAPVVLLVRRDWAMLGGMAAGAALSLVASIAAFGVSAWFDWAAAGSSFLHGVVLQGGAAKAISPAGLAATAGHPVLPFLLVGALVASVAVALSARRVEDESLIALCVAASLVVSPYCYIHDAIAIIPACVAMMLRGQWVYAIPAALIFFGTPILAMAGLMWLLSLFALGGLRWAQGENANSYPIGIGAVGGRYADGSR